MAKSDPIAVFEAMVRLVNGHEIGGYEWECRECHYHFGGRRCDLCNRTPARDEGYVDHDGALVDHDDLISRAGLLSMIETYRKVLTR